MVCSSHPKYLKSVHLYLKRLHRFPLMDAWWCLFLLSRLQLNLVDIWHCLTFSCRSIGFIETESGNVLWRLDFPDLFFIRFNPTSLDDWSSCFINGHVPTLVSNNCWLIPICWQGAFVHCPSRAFFLSIRKWGSAWLVWGLVPMWRIYFWMLLDHCSCCTLESWRLVAK